MTRSAPRSSYPRRRSGGWAPRSLLSRCRAGTWVVCPRRGGVPEVSTMHGEWIRSRRAEYGSDIRPLIDLGQILSAGPVPHGAAQPAARAAVPRRCAARTRPSGAPDGGVDRGLARWTPGGRFGRSGAVTLIRFTGLFKMTGYPAISIPCGPRHARASDRAPTRRPVGFRAPTAARRGGVQSGAPLHTPALVPQRGAK
jgi:hypothetical protein